MMNFKKEWEENEVKNVINTFSKWERQNLIITHGKREKDVEYTYGLPYTSSSSYAMLWNTNVEAEYKGDKNFKFDHLALTENNKVVVVLSDSEEKEMFIEI